MKQAFMAGYNIEDLDKEEQHSKTLTLNHSVFKKHTSFLSVE